MSGSLASVIPAPYGAEPENDGSAFFLERVLWNGSYDYGVENAAWSPDSRFLAAVITGVGLEVWSTADWKLLYNLSDFRYSIFALEWSPDSRYIAASSVSTVRVWDMKSAKIVFGYTGWGQRVSYAVSPSPSWSPSGDQLRILWWNNSLDIWNTATWRLALRHNSSDGHDGEVKWSPDGARVARYTGLHIWPISCCQNILVRNITDGRVLYVLGINNLDAGALAWSPDGSLLAVILGNENISFVDANTGQSIYSISIPVEMAGTLSWSHNGSQVAVVVSVNGSSPHTPTDDIILVRDATTGTARYSYVGYRSGDTAVAWSPEDSMIAIWPGRPPGNPTGSFRILNSSSGHLLFDSAGHLEEILYVAWSPDSTRLAVLSGKGTLSVWSTSRSTSSPTVQPAIEKATEKLSPITPLPVLAFLISAVVFAVKRR